MKTSILGGTVSGTGMGSAGKGGIVESGVLMRRNEYCSDSTRWLRGRIGVHPRLALLMIKSDRGLSGDVK